MTLYQLYLALTFSEPPCPHLDSLTTLTVRHFAGGLQWEAVHGSTLVALECGRCLVKTGFLTFCPLALGASRRALTIYRPHVTWN